MPDDSSTCAYCGGSFSPASVAGHEAGCSKNPANKKEDDEPKQPWD